MLYVLALGVFGIATTEFGIIGILPNISTAFDITIDKAGWLLSSFALVVAVSGPFAMLLLKDFNRKGLMVFVLGVFALSNIISVLASSFNVILFARILPAALHPVYWAVALSAAGQSAPASEAPKAIGIVFGGFTIASVLGVPVATLLASIFNWQSSFVLCAGINIISMLGMLLLLPDMPAGTPQSIQKQLSVLKKPGLWLGFALSCCMIAAMYATYGYMAGYLKDITKMNGNQISLMLLIFGVTGIAGNWLAGKLLSRNLFGTTLIFIISLAVVHVLLYFSRDYFILMVIMVAIWGVVHTAGFLISNINFTSTTTGAPEFVNSLFTTCGNLAVTVGSLLGGYWIVHFGIQQIIWSSVLCLTIALIILFVNKNSAIR